MTKSKPGTPTLDDLIAGSGELEDGRLAAALIGRVVIVPGALEVRFQDTMRTAPVQKKLVAAGLARHVMRRKDLLKQDELSAGNEWFATQTQTKPKTVTEQLSRLKRAGLMDRDGTGWFVPGWALEQAIRFLGEEAD